MRFDVKRREEKIIKTRVGDCERLSKSSLASTTALEVMILLI